MWSLCENKWNVHQPFVSNVSKSHFPAESEIQNWSKPYHVTTLITHYDVWSVSVLKFEYFSNQFWEICEMWLLFPIQQISYVSLSHFTASNSFLLTARMHVSLQKLRMLTPVHSDADNADGTEDADDYNRVIGIALLNAFNCAKN